MSKAEKTRREKEEEGYHRLTLNVALSLLVFFNLALTMGIILVSVILMINWNILSTGTERLNVRVLILYVALASVVLGSLISLFIGRLPLKSINQLIAAMNSLASGHFQTRLTLGPWITRISAVREMQESFNKMASELENTELLQSDFVNNFSHEFKTPIVSIAGFASLVRRGNLTESQKEEYLAAIEEESLRLSTMATNILSLTRVENQSILTNVRRFNLSEQMRSCVLLLEPKWSSRDLNMDIALEEHYLEGNEELLREVWLNLIDNAIKFTPTGGEIKIRIHPLEKKLAVTIANSGSEIPSESQDRIFQKFYQADESHATQGSGVGLAIVKKVVELHKGSVAVLSESGHTSFTVTLPA